MKLNKISIIGLGPMGYKIAQLYAEAGYHVTVWNRTKSKAEGLKAKFAESIADAISTSDIIIICVLNNEILHEALDTIQDKSIFQNKTVINYTSADPEDVDEIEQLINSYGAQYLNGAILISPDHLALPHSTILYGGNKEAYDIIKDVIDVTAGNPKHVGSKASASSSADLATLSLIYGTYVGMMYGAALCEASGISLDTFSDIFSVALPEYTLFLNDELKAVKNNDFTATQTPISSNVLATQRIANALDKIGATPDFPRAIALLMRNAEQRGYGNEELASVIKVIRSKN